MFNNILDTINTLCNFNIFNVHRTNFYMGFMWIDKRVKRWRFNILLGK